MCDVDLNKSLFEMLDDDTSKIGGETVREMSYSLDKIDENMYLPRQNEE